MILEEITIEEIHLVEMLTKAKQDEEKFNIIVWNQGFGLWYVNIGWGCFTYHFSMWDKAIRHFGIHIHVKEGKSYKEELKKAIKEIVNTKDYETNKKYFSSLVRSIGG